MPGLPPPHAFLADLPPVSPRVDAVVSGGRAAKTGCRGGPSEPEDGRAAERKAGTTPGLGGAAAHEQSRALTAIGRGANIARMIRSFHSKETDGVAVVRRSGRLRPEIQIRGEMRLDYD